jgi:hypothetical protein
MVAGWRRNNPDNPDNPHLEYESPLYRPLEELD